MALHQPQIELLLRGLWLAIGLYWFLGARRAGPSREHSGEAQSTRVFRLFLLALIFILLLSHGLRLGPLGGRFVPNGTVLPVLGFCMTLAGASLMVWARVHLGANWSDKVQIKEGHQLVRSGPYAILRHPIYTGVLLAVAGTALALGEWRGVLAFCILLVNYVIKARKEERILAARFGEDFRRHQRQTGFLVPRLSAKSTPSTP
jgi:protein-S-isoprenylcysteine O-methyltransferase Ste14